MERLKTIRPRNYLFEVLVFLNGIVLIGIWWLILRDVRKAILAGCISYLVLAWCLRLLFQRHHMLGIKHLRTKNYAEAAACFARSYEFFSNHPGIDRFRFITMFASSAIPYQHMALNNLGICYLYLGQDQQALDAFRKLAALNANYPNIDAAIDAIQRHMQETEEN